MTAVPAAPRGIVLTRGLLFALALAGFVGCPGAEHETLRLPAVTSDDPEAEAEIREAREAYEAGDAAEAEARYARFLEQRPDDPLVPIAHLGLGQILLADGRTEEARPHFVTVTEHEDPAVAERGRFYDGVAQHLIGNHREALEALRPFVGRTVDPIDTALLLRTIAAASSQVGDHVGALEALDALARAPVSDDDRDEARSQITDTIERAGAEDVQRAADILPRDGIAWPLVAKRALATSYEGGDMTRVHALAEALRTAGVELDDDMRAMAVRAERTAQADPNAIGAILPLSGRGREVGQLALKGLMLAAGDAPRGPADPDTPQVIFRDAGGSPEQAVRAVEDLVSLHRVIAIVGPIAGPTARAAARRAQELGVPMITLSASETMTDTGPMIFRLFVTPQAEVRDLVAAARTRGARRFAVLHPESAYGNRMRDVFREAVQSAGGEVAFVRAYESDATSFGRDVAELEQQAFDALFVPDSARRIALIAPALATGGLWSTPPGEAPGGDGRPITLLLPTVGFEATLARSSGRYLQGALFSVPFHAPTATGAGRRFADEFSTRFQTRPDAFAAFAYDAFRLIRGTVESGATTRAEVAARLPGGRADTASPAGGLSSSREPTRGTRLLTLDGDLFRPAE